MREKILTRPRHESWIQTCLVRIEKRNKVEKIGRLAVRAVPVFTRTRCWWWSGSEPKHELTNCNEKSPLLLSQVSPVQPSIKQFLVGRRLSECQGKKYNKNTELQFIKRFSVAISNDILIYWYTDIVMPELVHITLHTSQCYSQVNHLLHLNWLSTLCTVLCALCTVHCAVVMTYLSISVYYGVTTD